jgi:antitoxin YefM
VAKTVTFTEARAGLSSLIDEVVARHEHVVITRNGLPAAVLLSQAEFEAVQETLEVLGDADALEALRESDDDIRAGRVESLDDVKHRLAGG